MSHKKLVLDIKGMHCRSCELLLEDSLGSVKGVKKVRSNHKKGITEVEYEGNLSLSDVEKAVQKAGYNLGKEDKKHFFSRNIDDYMEVGAIVSILFVGYLLLRQLGLLNFEMSINQTPGLFGVLIVGLTAGISSCMALIGGLVLGISSRHAELHPEATALQKFRPHIFFNIGRLVSYVLLGGLIGLLGSALKLSSTVLGFITVILGLVMLVLGLKLIEIFPWLHNKSLMLPKSVIRLFGIKQETKEYSHRGAFITGALTFFVPCGFTQAMQLYAVSTGSFVQGAFIMGIFALGTLPGIIGIGGLTSAVKGNFAKYFFKFAGVVVIILATYNISNGYRLTGIVLPSFSLQSINEIKMENGKQVIEMTQSGSGYSPNELTIKKGIPVVWKIKSTNPYTCAAYIRIPAVGVAQPLRPGENSIEFTAPQSGKIRFTCSMGMYGGILNVID